MFLWTIDVACLFNFQHLSSFLILVLPPTSVNQNWTTLFREAVKCTSLSILTTRPDVSFSQLVLRHDIRSSHLLALGLVLAHDLVHEVVQDSQDQGRENQVHDEVDAVDVHLSQCNL